MYFFLSRIINFCVSHYIFGAAKMFQSSTFSIISAGKLDLVDDLGDQMLFDKIGFANLM